MTGAVAVFSDTAPPESLTELVPRIAPPRCCSSGHRMAATRQRSLTPEYHRVAGPNASLWAIPHAQHIKGIETQPRAYERRVVAFFDDALLAR